jgi:hypothetical protein
MLLSGENGVGKSAVAGRWLRTLEPKTYFPICITQASLTGIGLLGLFLQKLGQTPRHQHGANLKLLEEAFGELGRVVPVLLLDEAQNYSSSALEEVRMLLGLTLPEPPTPGGHPRLGGRADLQQRPALCRKLFCRALRDGQPGAAAQRGPARPPFLRAG